MKKIEFLAFLILTIFVSCTSNNENRPINAIPEYGHQEKSEMQLQADQNFLDEIRGRESETFIALIDEGWWYLEQGDSITAVKRFNQAWLIDSTRFETYWGFAAAEKEINNFETSRLYYEKALALCKDSELQEIVNKELSELLHKKDK